MKQATGSKEGGGGRQEKPTIPRDLPAECFVELIDSIDDFIIVTDGESRIIRVNRAMSLLSGYSNGELAEKSLFELVESRERRRLSANRGRCGGETTMMTKGRVSVSVEFSASRIIVASEGFEGNLFVCRPMAAPAGDDDALKTGAIRRRILNSIGEPLFMISFTARTICECNQCAVDLSGRPRSELIGRSMLEFMTFGEEGEGVNSRIERINDAYAGMGFFHSRVLMARKRGNPVPCDCFSIPFFLDSGKAGYTILALIDRSEEEKRMMLLAEFAERAGHFASDLSSLAAKGGSRQVGRLLSTQGFTPRQVEIAKLVFEGCPSKEIGGMLGISESTVKNHIAAMFKKIGATSRVDFLHKLNDERIWIA